MHLKESLLFVILTWVKVTQSVAQYSLHHVAYAPAKFEVKIAMANSSGLEVIKLEYILRLKIKHNDWLLVDTCPHATNHCALF